MNLLSRNFSPSKTRKGVPPAISTRKSALFCWTPILKTFRGLHPARKFKPQSVPPIHTTHVISGSSRVSSSQKQQDEAAAYLLTQVEQPPILESPICQGRNRVPVDGNNSFCQSCKEFYLAVSGLWYMLVLAGNTLTLV